MNTLSTPGIPTITAVVSSSAASSPEVTYMDRLDRTAGTSGIGFGLTEITATDGGGTGRAWSVMIEDQGTVGSVDVQFPDLSGIGVLGLATGTWSIRAEEFLYLSTTFAVGDFLHEERFRHQAAYARAVAMTFTVN